MNNQIKFHKTFTEEIYILKLLKVLTNHRVIQLSDIFNYKEKFLNGQFLSFNIDDDSSMNNVIKTLDELNIAYQLGSG